MIEANLKRATELFHNIDRLQERRDDARRMSPGLCIKYLMEPDVGIDEQGNRRVIDECDAALLLEIPPDDLKRLVTETIVKCISDKIEVNRKALKKLGVRLEDEVNPEKPQKSAKLRKSAELLQLPAPVRKKAEAA